jgi:hypothetical protein
VSKCFPLFSRKRTLLNTVDARQSQNGRAAILLSNVPLAFPDTQLCARAGHDLAGTINEFGVG